MKKRALVLAAGLGLALSGAAPASSHTGHGSCQVFGLAGAFLAREGQLVGIIQGAGPGAVDDGVRVAHLVGFGEGPECVPW